MNKVVVLLSGTPTGKSKFDSVCKEIAWVWNLNLKNSFGNIAKSLGWKGERDERYYSFLNELLALSNKHFNYEREKLFEKVENFRCIADDVKVSEDGKVFENFVLILHGVTRGLSEELKEEFGVYKIRISSRPPKEEEPSEREWGDFVLYEDDGDYDKQVEKLILGLLKG